MKRFQDRYPGYSDEAYAMMEKLHSGPMAKAKQAEALALFSQGHSREQVCKQLKISNGALQVSLRYDPDFSAKWKKLAAHRPKQINEKLIETLLRGTTEYRVKWLPKRGDDGKPLYINGRQQFEIASKEKIRKPPSDALIQFFLKATDPTYGATADEQEQLPIAEVLKDVRVNLMKIRSDETNVN